LFPWFTTRRSGNICEDEADDLDESPEKMKIYKSENTAGFKVARTNIPHIIYNISTNTDLSFEFSQIFLQTNREGAGKRWIVKKD
jgi:hypothetical protein